uniref:Uncharacterized protein n=1 Tax=Anguilla anguilla TaxID=7936 RepID=A0A0E9QH19_ANGAN
MNSSNTLNIQKLFLIGITIFIYINTKTANAFKNKLPFLY